MKAIFKTVLTAVAAAAAFSAQAATYEYVGSFTTNGYSIFNAGGSASSNPAANWWDNPIVYSGVEAAAYLFGGTAAGYRLSTVFGLTAPNGLAWYDGWGDHDGQQFADTYKLDSTGLGYNGCAKAGTDCMYSSYSAYVNDGFSATNYVYREVVAPVPEPETYAMLLAGLGLVAGAVARRRKQQLDA